MRRIAGLLLSLSTLLYVPRAWSQESFCNNPTPGCQDNPQCRNPEDVPPKCLPCEDLCQRSPCFLGSGRYVTTARDLRLPTAGFPLTMERHYKSSRVIDGVLGIGWTSSLTARVYYTTYLYAAPSTYRREADVMMPEGVLLRFVDEGDGTFTPPAGRYDVLVKNANGTFDLTLQRSRTRYHFGPGGMIETMTDEYGNTLQFTYDGNGRLQRAADGAGSGRYLDVFWGADGRISQVVDHSGRRVSYHYDTQGLMQWAEDAAGRRTTYGYTAGRFVPLLTSILDPWNRSVASVQYDRGDRTVHYTEGGESYSYSYEYQNNLNRATKTDSFGNTWDYTFEPTAGLILDDNPPAGSGGAPRPSMYNTDGTIARRVDEVGVETTYTYTKVGRIETMTRDATGPNAIRFDFGYDATYPEKIVSVTPMNPGTGFRNHDWQAWFYDYYGAGSAAPGALWHVMRSRRDGTVETVATYEYDSRGRVTRQLDANEAPTSYHYDTAGNLWYVDTPLNGDDPDAEPPRTIYQSDSVGRVITVHDPEAFQTQYTYDALDRVTTIRRPGRPDLTTTYSYDHYDTLSTLVFTHITDPNGRVTKLGYDEHGRLRQSIDAAGHKTTYGYTGGLLTTIYDANQNVTRYEYDGLRRLVRTHLQGGHEDYGYFADGLLESRMDRKGQTIRYTYDGLKRLKTKTWPSGAAITMTYQGQMLTGVNDGTTSPSEVHAFTYDGNYRVATEAQGGRGTLSYTYDPMDRVATMAIQGGPTTTSYYHPDGSLGSVEWSPVPGEFHYRHYRNGLFANVVFPNGQYRAYAYDGAARVSEVQNTFPGTGLATFTYGYDTNYAGVSGTMKGQRTSVVATVPSLGMTNAQTRYSYDALYQLTRVDYPGVAPYNGAVESWTYDAIGNRLTSTSNGVTATYEYGQNAFGNNDQRLLTDGTSTYTHDANGNVTGRAGGQGTYTFGYDAENRLTSIGGSITASYTYDYQGRRTSKTVGGVTTTYLYNAMNLVAERSGGATTHVIFGPGIDEPLATSRNGVVSYLSADALGTVVATSTSAGAVSHAATDDAWGVRRGEMGTSVHPFGYTGREVGEAGLLFYRARYYQPGIGRFASEDPLPGLVAAASRALTYGERLTDSRTSNRSYPYADNLPTTLIDPTGESAAGITFGAGCAAADGPLPLGDIILLAMVIDHFSRIPPTPPDPTCRPCEAKPRPKPVPLPPPPPPKTPPREPEPKRPWDPAPYLACLAACDKLYGDPQQRTFCYLTCSMQFPYRPN